MIRKTKKNANSNRPVYSLWRRCTSLKALKQIHGFMVINGFNSNPSALRELIFHCAITVSGAMDYAHKLFRQILEPDSFVFNTMIRGSSQSSTPSDAFTLYTQMESTHIRPDKFTFPFLLKACSRLSSAFMGNQFHTQISKLGFESDMFVRNTLIHLHATCGSLEVAEKLFDESGKRDVVAWSALLAGHSRRGSIVFARNLFDEMPNKDLVAWNVMLTAYTKCGDMESARRLFDKIEERDVVSWNAMISGYVLAGSHVNALELFEEMLKEGETPDDVTMLSLLSSCAHSGALDIGRKIHSLLTNNCSRDITVVLGNALVDMYAKCGSIESAMHVFREMRDRDVSSWNSVIGGLAFHGYGKEAISMFSEMQGGDVRPNEITFVGVLVACSHVGMVDEGQKYFELMREKYGIEHNIKHYGCMVDMLGRAGLLKEAFGFVEGMPMETNAIVWRTLLGACRIHGNVELAEVATKRLLELRPDQSGDYVLLSNVYASIGEWGGAENVRRLMGDRGVKKEPGCSSIEMDSELIHFLFDSNPSQT
ncbi:pentatricopeptide repeat-containing protein At5g15300 [Amborella trichopoda]|uniref:pentatricopeptide repeat-containing protein At5g15300 n=1 Tax=Amborella trichopoda TaxID=13333 RepID=UPI0005D2FF3C|nr:pentatricopeptide repeat-containing protein At5g15300 [Amborella trichopoda]|eukprot:XP_011622415.1 pentatricopeptide repeat-containing protein At5g15300 [Amborella trichopoda]